jgi:small nuclear ribonucleoprotein (snRNP)-like protein
VDTALHHFCNREFVKALKGLRGRNILLLLFDGSAVFGRIGIIDDWEMSILPASGIAGVNTVRFRPPNSSLPDVDILLSEMLLDVCDIVAAVEGPYVIPPISKVCTTPAVKNNQGGSVKAKAVYTRPHSKVIDDFEDFVGQNVGVLCLGGWVVGGQLSESDDCLMLFGPGTATAPLLLTLGALNIFGPALTGGLLPLFGTFRSWVNLQTVTSILIP